MTAVVSPLARVVADRGGGLRDRPALIVLHSTGGTIVERAREAGTEPFDEAVSWYRDPEHDYPHYLIGWGGEVACFCPEERAAQHAAWRGWERTAYERGTWEELWASDFRDAVKGVPTSNYRWWRARWPGVASPIALLEQAAGEGATPNRTSVGIELLAREPFTESQITACARLVLDIALRWAISLAPALPHATLLGHEDLNPCRRTTKSGRPWDPGASLSWSRLARELQVQSDLTDWRP